MPQFLIGGINVEFPKTPYPCQIQYMEHVIRALSSGSNALLESPTGTGKTLCLLCATLAWQESRKSKPIELAYSSGKSVDAGPGGIKTSVMPGEKKSAPYTIVYATRTHSQLAQVVSELRETAYRPRMTVLGSREQLCVHEKVSKLKNGVINHACNSLNSKRGCMYRNNLDNYIESNSSMDNTGMMDIEEMVKLGNHRKICPYFHSREFCASSDIVLLPYNYLLDGNIRSSVKVDWTNAIIIFDEAHNLERVSADAASFSLSSTDLALCIQEMQQVLGTLRDEQQRTKAPSEVEAQAKVVVPANPAAAGSGQDKPSLAAVVTLLKAMFELEKRIDALQILPHAAQQQTLPGIVYEGHWLPDLLKAVGFTDVMHVVELKKCCNMLMEIAQDTLGFDASGASAAAVEPKLQAFTSSMARVLNSVKSRSSIDYKVYIADEVVKPTGGTYAAEGRAVQKKRVINYWCFSTGVAMQELQNLGVKSLLLTSGTLSPMGALKEDIKLPFPIQLENPHVIGDNQMWVAALPTGVSGKALNSSFQSRDTSAYKDELGLSVLQICNTMAGGPSPSTNKPPVNAGWAAYGVTAVATAPAAPAPRVRGGVLIFFPSYAVMENVAARWKETGVHDKLRNSVGAVLMEPKGAGISNAGGAPAPKRTNGGFHSGRDHHPAVEGNFMLNGGVTRKPKVLDDEDGEGGEEFRTIVGQFEHAIKVNGGCVLLAVCRGKVSEGIDFTDNKGRVVIITGIPFAPYMDPWVVLKKQYLDDKSSGKLVAPPTLSAPADAGPMLNLAAFQRPVTASAYPVVMGPPAVPAVPTAHAQAFGGASAAVPPAAPSGYGPYGSGVVSGYGAPSVSASAAVKKAVPSQSLNGQGWYSQTAGRAVNQCIGRVIRHNKDWGTVFLLDDRFMNDRQISQLSGWVKPRVKKFTSFESALKGFRAFITVAAQDKSLVSQSMAQRAAEPAPDIERFRRREASEKPKEATFMRQIEIHESELSGTGEDNTFINPSFLLTQTSSVRSTREEPVVERDSEKDMLSLFRKSASSSSGSQSTSKPVSQLSEAGKGSLLDAFSRSREKTSTTSLSVTAVPEPVFSGRTESHFDRPLAPPLTISYSSDPANNGAAASAKPAATSFGLGAASKPASFFVPEKIVRTKDSTIADYFAPPKPVPAPQAQAQVTAAPKSLTHSQATPKPQSTIARPPAVVKKSGLDIPKFSQSGSNSSTGNSARDAPPSSQSSQPSFLKYLSKLDDDMNDAPDPVTNFHNQIAVLKGLLSKDKLLALKSKLMLAKGSVVSTIAHLRHFLASVMTILDGVDAMVKLRALRSFVCMLPGGLGEDYLELVSEAVQDNAQTPKSAAFGSGQGLSKPLSGSSSGGARDVSLSERARNTSVMDAKRKAEEDRLYSQSQSQSAFLTQDVKLEGGQLRSAPSKRAKLMLSASLAARTDSGPSIKTEGGEAKLQTNAAQSSVRGGSALAFLSKMSNLDSIALTGAVKTSNSAESRSNRVGSANLACTVCKEQPATDPCAARCGHVCCQVCWTKWLRVNQSCPQCRQPADVNSVTRIVVKR